MLNQKKEILKAASSVIGFDVLNIDQGSTEWQLLKLGVVSASEISSVLAKSTTQAYQNYLYKIVAQICSGEPDNEFNAKATNWGKENEDAARIAYHIHTTRESKPFPFMFKDLSLSVGCSPDGVVEKDNGGTEIKCPYSSKNFIEFAVADKVKPEWEKQCQFSLWVSGFSYWDLVYFDPRMIKSKIIIKRFEPNEKIFEQFENEVGQFIIDRDKALLKMGHKFGDQWRDRIDVAREHLRTA